MRYITPIILAAAASGVSAQAPVEITHAEGLVIYAPHYSRIDLVTEEMPAMADSSVIFVCEAAYTGRLLEEFSHDNIAGDHVSGGRRYAGYNCPENTASFTWSATDGPRFNYGDTDRALDGAAMGFGQEMLITGGEIVEYARPKDKVTHYRALCLWQGKLCVIDGDEPTLIGEFVDRLHRLGVDQAIYLDMGRGWNYSWYRDADGKAIEIHPLPGRFTTNWITFYR